MTPRSGFVAVLVAACGVAGPVPLEWDEASCTHCHMTLADRRFGAEVVTTKGRALQFDDVGCAAEHIAARGLPVAAACSQSVSPIAASALCAALANSVGSPASARIFATSSVIAGACDAGLRMTAFPLNSAGAIFHAGIAMGKFHGVINATTPSGSRRV